MMLCSPARPAFSRRVDQHCNTSSPGDNCIMADDAFAAGNSDDSYDPQRVWFATRNPKPPYETNRLQMYYPQWFVHDITKFLYDDSSKTFTSAQQVLHNAEYHGFHHMKQQGYVVDELARGIRLINDMNEIKAFIASQDGMIQSIQDAARAADTEDRRKVVQERVRRFIAECSDAELVEKLRRYLT